MNKKDQKLVEYIQLSLNQGKSKEEVYKELLNQGWSIDEINNAFNDAFNKIVIKDKKERIQKRTIFLVVIIGAILVSFGIFSFIAANWQKMAKTTKVLMIIILMIASYVSGWFLREKQYYKKTGEALLLLGVIIYGGGIFLIAQIFNIRGNWPDGFILWMIGSIIMAFAIESFYVFYLAILVGAISIIGYPSNIIVLLTSRLLLLVATILTFVTGWLINKRIPPELKDFY